MAEIIWADVTAIAPELTRVPAAGQVMILCVANTILAPDVWGGEESPKLKAARSYYAAHLGAMTLRGGNPGVPTSSAVGGMSRGYSLVNLGTFSVLQLTSYGLLFLQLAKTTPARAGFSMGMVPAPQGLQNWAFGGNWPGWPGGR